MAYCPHFLPAPKTQDFNVFQTVQKLLRYYVVSTQLHSICTTNIYVAMDLSPTNTHTGTQNED